MIRKIEQFIWEGRPIVNQIIVSTDNRQYLVSYGKTVASKGTGGIILSTDWNCSRTTSKYVSRFLNCSAREIKNLIEKKVITIVSELTIE